MAPFEFFDDLIELVQLKTFGYVSPKIAGKILNRLLVAVPPRNGHWNRKNHYKRANQTSVLVMGSNGKLASGTRSRLRDTPKFRPNQTA